MVMTYYCAYLRKIAWPQVNRSEAKKDNAICVKLSYVFSNVASGRAKCGRSARQRRRDSVQWACLNKPESKRTWQILPSK